jgi:hypothetical protein
MSSSTLFVRVGLAFAFFFILVSPRPTRGDDKKVQVKVYVLDDEAKGVGGILIHIVPDGRWDPPPQITDSKGALQFEIERTTSFSIAFYSEGRILGVLRGMAGFEDQLVRVNYKRLSSEGPDSDILRLAEIGSYTKALRARREVSPKVIALLKAPAFLEQINVMRSTAEGTEPKMMCSKIEDDTVSLPSK